MLNLYLRKAEHNYGFDVLAYKEEACLVPVARWTWDNPDRPDKRFKSVMFNCFRWGVVWKSPQ